MKVIFGVMPAESLEVGKQPIRKRCAERGEGARQGAMVRAVREVFDQVTVKFDPGPIRLANGAKLSLP